MEGRSAGEGARGSLVLTWIVQERSSLRALVSADGLGAAGDYARSCFGAFDFDGNALVWVPDARTIFTGDILFVGGTPIVWEGPISNWVAACDLMLDLDLETVVPGHGPVTDKRGIADVRGYLSFVEESARSCFDAGLDVEAAEREIALGAFSTWSEKERLAVNVDTAYRELRGDGQPTDVMRPFELMAQLAK